MKILFYGINFSPELTGVGKYSGDMVNYLVSKGHQIRVITAPPYYPGWKVSDNYKWWKFKIDKVSNKLTIYRCPLFVPKTPTFITRLIHLLSFAASSFPLMVMQIFWRPTLVFFVEPSLFCAPSAIFTAKLCKARSMLHIQDYEIDAMFGLGLMKKTVLLRFAKAIERFIMRSCDRVSTISDSMVNLAIDKGIPKNKVILFPNWVDTKLITPSSNRQRFRQEWGINEGDKVILYSGNIGKKQGLEIVLDAAEYFMGSDNIHFFIVGEGAHKSTLVHLAKEKQLSNVHFKSLQPYDDLPDLLGMADIHLIIQKKGAADIVLPSKLTGILSAGGHALLTAEPHTELGLLARHCPGIAHFIEPESVSKLITGLNALLNADTTQPNLIARKYAIEVLDHDVVLDRFEHELTSFVYN